jgi:hypothetical protein
MRPAGLEFEGMETRRTSLRRSEKSDDAAPTAVRPDLENTHGENHEQKIAHSHTTQLHRDDSSDGDLVRCVQDGASAADAAIPGRRRLPVRAELESRYRISILISASPLDRPRSLMARTGFTK